MAEAPTALAALLVAMLAMAPLIHALSRLRVIDVPNNRSSHSRVTPRGGGIAVIAGLMVGAAVGGASSALRGFLALAFLGAAIGLADDVRGLPVKLRLLAQFVLSAGLLAAIQTSPDPLAWILAPIAIIGIVGYVNAFNFMDGINGISALSAIVAGAWFALLGFQSSDQVLVVGGLALLGACIGFLPWNLPDARVFLGDAGSYGLGFLIAALSVHSLSAGSSLLSASAPLLIYFADTSFTLVRRTRRGESWREPHREHGYQLLCAEGLTHLQAAVVVTGASTLTCLATYLLPALAACGMIAALISGYLALPWLLRKPSQQTSS